MMRIDIKMVVGFVILVGILLMFWFKWDSIIGKKTPPISPQSTNTIQDITPLDIPQKYNQTDKRWSNDLLGNTNEQLGKVGCLVSSIAMNLSYYHINLNPQKLNELLRELNGYTKNGWVIWSKIEALTQDKLLVEFPELSHQNIDHFLLQKKPVLAKILINQRIPHWVLIVGKKEGEYLIYDPLSSSKIKLISVYRSLIYSIRVLLLDG